MKQQLLVATAVTCSLVKGFWILVQFYYGYRLISLLPQSLQPSVMNNQHKVIVNFFETPFDFQTALHNATYCICASYSVAYRNGMVTEKKRVTTSMNSFPQHLFLPIHRPKFMCVGPDGWRTDSSVNLVAARFLLPLGRAVSLLPPLSRSKILPPAVTSSKRDPRS